MSMQVLGNQLTIDLLVVSSLYAVMGKCFNFKKLCISSNWLLDFTDSSKPVI